MWFGKLRDRMLMGSIHSPFSPYEFSYDTLSCFSQAGYT